MNLKYFDFVLVVKGIVFIFFIVVFLIFGCFIWCYGWEEFVVEKVFEDLDKVDGVVIEEIDVEDVDIFCEKLIVFMDFC